MIGKKSLTFNTDKSCYLLMGGKKERRRLQKELSKSPLTLCKEPMKEVKIVKYLGNFFTYSLEDSIHQTVIKRLGLAKHAIYELRDIVEDTRAKKIGGINIAFDIFDNSITSIILHNSETWNFIPNKTINLIDRFFNSFYTCIFRIGSGSPSANNFWQVGALTRNNILLKKQLSFYFHLSSLPPDSLANQVFTTEQMQDI